MQIKVSKEVLKELQSKKGCLDTDSGKIFVGVRGRIHLEDKDENGRGRYHLDVIFADPEAGNSAAKISLGAIIKGDSKPASKPADTSPKPATVAKKD